MSPKQYNLILLVPLGSLAIVFILLSLWVQPIAGDLTRTGGFTENDFGWNKPQQRFDVPLFTLKDNREYNQYYDVLVFGDSFSLTFPRTQWQNYFVHGTGLSLATYKIDDIDFDSFVAGPVYRDHPPKIVIYQTVERSFVGRGTEWNKGDCRTASTGFQGNPVRTLPGSQATQPHMRNTRNGPFHPNLSSGAHYLKRLIKKTFNKKSNRAIKIPLNRDDLFSNRQSGDLLVYSNDFERYQVSKEDLSRAICGLSYIQNTFQKNGKTFFVALVAPDKLTAYQDFTRDFDREKIQWMETIAQYPKLHTPRLDLALQGVIAQGTQDVYLPNDTHWGSVGHQTVAQFLIQYLKQKKVLSVQQRPHP